LVCTKLSKRVYDFIGLIMEKYFEEFEYLNTLRESGVTNMFGAAPYLEQAFGVDRREAKTILKLWMESFKETV
jgi:hypothetical protein